MKTSKNKKKFYCLKTKDRLDRFYDACNIERQNQLKEISEINNDPDLCNANKSDLINRVHNTAYSYSNIMNTVDNWRKLGIV